MKEIKAYVHRHRAADVIEAIQSTQAWSRHPERHQLSVTLVQGTLPATDSAERHYSVELGMEVVHACRIELHCDDACVDELVAAVRAAGHTGQTCAGWVFVCAVDHAHPIP